MYYLGSRFYDPVICRFINADDISNLAANNDFISFNLYTYCLNNPVNRIDEDGNLSVLNCVKVAIGAVAFAGAIALTVATGGSAATIAIGVAKIASSVALSTLASGYAGYRSNGKQGMIDGLCNGFMFGSLSACAGAVSKSIDIAKATSGTPNSMGQAGERLAHINPKAKTTIRINGRNRIPDKLTKRTLTEVKNVKYISNTRQLRDFADYADIYGLKKILYVRPNTRVASSLIRAGWKVKYLW